MKDLTKCSHWLYISSLNSTHCISASTKISQTILNPLVIVPKLTILRLHLNSSFQIREAANWFHESLMKGGVLYPNALTTTLAAKDGNEDVESSAIADSVSSLTVQFSFSQTHKACFFFLLSPLWRRVRSDLARGL